MGCYVGLDVSVKETSNCVMGHDGEVIARDDVSSDPNVIAAFVAARAPDAERVVHESGILAIWLTRELDKRGVPIICIDARLAHKALSGRINKSDPGMLRDWRTWRGQVGTPRFTSAPRLPSGSGSSSARGNV